MLAATLSVIPPNLVSAVLYDVLKTHFSRPKRQDKTAFSFSVRSSESQSMHCHLETDDSAVLKEALAAFRDLALTASHGHGYEFDVKKASG